MISCAIEEGCDVTAGSYKQIAGEYYDIVRHPTCASLRELSERYILGHLAIDTEDNSTILEVGAGKSVIAPILAAKGASLSKLVLLDSSPDMLSYSSEWASAGARLLVSEAEATGLPDRSVLNAVSCLGDPYNTPEFWQEIARVLRADGVCHFTTPAFEWASRFRPSDEQDLAEFVRADGATLLVPSFVPSIDEQLHMLHTAGLEVAASAYLTILDLAHSAAPKLFCVPAGEPVVRGYSVRLDKGHRG